MEEQFYLVLPLVIMWVRKNYLVHVLLGLCVAAVAIRCAFSNINPLAALTLLPSRMDLLLGGVILAYAWRRFDLARYLLVFRIGPLAALVSLLVISVVASDKKLFLILKSHVGRSRNCVAPSGGIAWCSGGAQISLARTDERWQDLIWTLLGTPTNLRIASWRHPQQRSRCGKFAANRSYIVGICDFGRGCCGFLEMA